MVIGRAKLGRRGTRSFKLFALFACTIYLPAVYTPCPAALPIDCIWTVESIVYMPVYSAVVGTVVARSTFAEKCILPHFVSLNHQTR
jgi:hypothetical protein